MIRERKFTKLGDKDIFLKGASGFRDSLKASPFDLVPDPVWDRRRIAPLVRKLSDLRSWERQGVN